MVALSRVFSRPARTKVTDVTSGFKAMGPRAIKLFACYYPAEYLGDTVESLAMAIRAKLIREVPVVMLERAGGTPSHLPIKRAERQVTYPSNRPFISVAPRWLCSWRSSAAGRPWTRRIRCRRDCHAGLADSQHHHRQFCAVGRHRHDAAAQAGREIRR